METAAEEAPGGGDSPQTIAGGDTSPEAGSQARPHTDRVPEGEGSVANLEPTHLLTEGHHLTPADLPEESHSQPESDLIDFTAPQLEGAGTEGGIEGASNPGVPGDEDHSQIKVLLAQLRSFDGSQTALGNEAELAFHPALDDLKVGSSEFLSGSRNDAEGELVDRLQSNTIICQDVLDHNPLITSVGVRPASLGGDERQDTVVDQGCESNQTSHINLISWGNNNHLLSDSHTNYPTPECNNESGEMDGRPGFLIPEGVCSWTETASECVPSQAEHIAVDSPKGKVALELNVDGYTTTEDSSLDDQLPRRQTSLSKDWKKEGQALSLAVKELKEEVESISKSFLSDDTVEDAAMASQGLCPEEGPKETALDGEEKKKLCYPAFKEVSGPCESEDLLDGILFAANYLGSTQLFSEKNPSISVRMAQAQEAVGRIKAPEGESQPMTQVDLFISTQRIKVLNADSQEALMDHSLQTISYIADIGTTIVLMARRRIPRKTPAPENSSPSLEKREYKMICHVFESADASLIAQAIGQAFSVAYQQFLNANGINPGDLSPTEYNDLLDTDFYNGDLVHFSKSENSKEVHIEKGKGEILGIVIVESGWGSILPTVVIANLMHGGCAERSGELNIGDQIISVNGTSLVGLPLATGQGIIKDLKYQTEIKLNIVRCPPVTTAIIKRPDVHHQLGFSVQDGIIYSLMRGGIAERGGIRVGHRIIEINGQSVVATPHEKIVHRLSNAIGEIHIKTMPAATYRLLTGQEQPIYI